MPPIIWTSKWRIPIVRGARSRARRRRSRAAGRRATRRCGRARAGCRPAGASSSSSRSSSSGSHALMRSTRLAYCLNCLPSPSRRARSRIDMAQVERRGRAGPRGYDRPAAGRPRRRPAAAAASAAAARCSRRLRRLSRCRLTWRPSSSATRLIEWLRSRDASLRAQRDALEVQRRLGHLGLRVGRVALLADLDLEHGQLGDLLGDLRRTGASTCSRSSSVTGRLRPLTSICMGLLSSVPAVLGLAAGHYRPLTAFAHRSPPPPTPHRPPSARGRRRRASRRWCGRRRRAPPRAAAARVAQRPRTARRCAARARPAPTCRRRPVARACRHGASGSPARARERRARAAPAGSKPAPRAAAARRLRPAPATSRERPAGAGRAGRFAAMLRRHQARDAGARRGTSARATRSRAAPS